MNIYKVKKWAVSPEKKKEKHNGEPEIALKRLEKTIASFGQVSNTRITIGKYTRTNSVIKELSLTDLGAKIAEGKSGMTESMSQAFNSNSSFRKLSRKDGQRSMQISHSRKHTYSPSQSFKEASFEISPMKIPASRDEPSISKEPRVQGLGLSFARECFHQRLIEECRNLPLTCDLLNVRESMNQRNELSSLQIPAADSRLVADVLYRMVREVKELVDENVNMAIPTLIDKVDRVLRQTSLGVSELSARLVGSGQEYMGWSLDYLWKMIVYCLDGYINWGTVGISESIRKEKLEFQGKNADLLAIIKDKDLKIGLLEERIANLRRQQQEEKTSLSAQLERLKHELLSIKEGEERARALMEEVRSSRMPGLQTTCLRLRGELERFEEEHNQHLKLSLEEMRKTAKSLVGQKKTMVSRPTQTATGATWSKYFEPNLVKATVDALKKVDAVYAHIRQNPLKLFLERPESDGRGGQGGQQGSDWLELFELFFETIDRREMAGIGFDLLDQIVRDSLPQQVTLKAMSERLNEFFGGVLVANGNDRIVADLFMSIFDPNEQTKLSQHQWKTFCEFKKELCLILSNIKDIAKEYTLSTQLSQANVNQIIALLKQSQPSRVDDLLLEIEWLQLKHIIYQPVPELAINLPKKHLLRDTLSENHKVTFAQLIRSLIEETELADPNGTRRLTLDKADAILKSKCQLSCAIFKSAFPDTFEECLSAEGLFRYDRCLVEISRFYTKQIRENSTLLTTRVAHFLQAFVVLIKREVTNRVMSRVKAIVKDGVNTDLNKISKLLFKAQYTELEGSARTQMLALLAGVSRIISVKAKDSDSASSLTPNLQNSKIIKKLIVECYEYNTKQLINP